MNSRPDIKNLGIIAGAGDLPGILADSCERQGIETFIVGFEKYTKPEIMKGRQHLWGRLGGAGHIIKTLKNHDIHDLVMIGAIRRPSLAELKPDLKTAGFYARIGLRALGDNDFLGLLIDELKREGLTVHGIQDFATELLVPAGKIGLYLPHKKQKIGIERGIKIARLIGDADIGQSVIIQQGQVIGVEAVEGTDELIKRCMPLYRKGDAGILIKLCKPYQNRTLDLPTIGPETIALAAKNNICGIVIQSEATLVVDKEKVADYANQNKMFVLAIDPADYGEI